MLEAHLVGESALRLIVDQHPGELEGERLTGGVLRRRRAAIAEEHGREEGCLQGADDARRHRGAPQAPPPLPAGRATWTPASRSSTWRMAEPSCLLRPAARAIW